MKKLAAIALCAVPLLANQIDAADKVDFEKQVLPVFAKKCLGCHGEKKGKAKLRLHTAENSILGGKSKKAIVPGKPDESGIVLRAALPRDHEDAMPPEDEGEPMTKEEIELIKRWVAEGAVYPGGPIVKKERPKGAPLTDADQKKLESIRKAGARAMRVAQDVNWISVSFRPAAAKTGDDQVALVKGLANVTELNLAGTKITDDGLANIAELGNLTRLHLERTAIQGTGLAHLKGLNKLEYLNLYGTTIDDAALANLGELKSLKKLYLWQTKVSDAGVDALKKTIPDLYVNRGIDPPAKAHPGSESPKEPEKTAEKKPEKKPEPTKPTKTAKVLVAASSDGWLFSKHEGVEGDAWAKEGFDAGKWAKAKAPIGYGEAAVQQKKGTELELKGQSVLFRRYFDVDDATLKEAKGVRLLVASDNSAIVWINGKQVDSDTDNHEPKYWNRTVSLDAKVIKKGRNVVAVQLNNNQGSSDALLDLQLETLKP